jgi:hypothetical protein
MDRQQHDFNRAIQRRSLINAELAAREMTEDQPCGCGGVCVLPEGRVGWRQTLTRARESSMARSKDPNRPAGLDAADADAGR